MTIYSDDLDTTGYGDYTDYSSDSTDSCCATSEAPVFEEWIDVDPAPTYGETEWVWEEPEPSVAAVMPLAQPGTTEWQPVTDAGELYSQVATIGEPTSFGGGLGSYSAESHSLGELVSSWGVGPAQPTGSFEPTSFGGGLGSYSAESHSLGELINSWGTGPAQPTGPMFEPSVRYITAPPSGAARLHAILAGQGDVVGQLINQETIGRQAWTAGLWTS